MKFLQRRNILCNKASCLILQLFRAGGFGFSCAENKVCFNFLSTQSLEKAEIVNNLVSIFTTPPFDSQELANFGSKLTTEIVESSLKSFKNWKIALRFFYWASTQTGYKHNCYTYNAMASILSSARQNAPLKALAKDMIDSRCNMSPGALGFLLRCFGSLGMVEEAGMLFDQVKMMGLCIPSSYSYNALLEGISKSGSVDLLEMRLNEMREDGQEPDKYTLTPVLGCYCNSACFEKALDVFYQMNDRGWVDSHVFTMMVHSFTKWGRVEEAFDLIERMECFKINLNETTFYVLIHGFVKEKRVDKALQLFDKMLRFQFVPGISLYSVLIEGLCKNKEHEKALQLFSQMKDLGIVPDVNLLTVLVSSLPDEREMITLFKETRKSLVDNKSLISVYNSILSSLVNNGLTEKAYHLLKAMLEDENLLMAEETVFPDTISFKLVIDGLCQTGKIDVALGLFKDMDRIRCPRSLLLYNNLINVLSSSNRLDECHELLAEMKDLGFRPSQFTYNSILGCLCRREDVTAALHLLQEMRSSGHEPWIKHYTLLVMKLCKNQRAIDSIEFLDKMVQEGFMPNIIAYSAAIDGLIKMHEVDQALKLFRKICARGQYPDVVAYNTILTGLCKVKRLLEVQDVLNEMIEKGLAPSVVTYNLLIDGYCKTGDIDQAIALCSKMKKEQREPNVFTYTTIIDGLCSAGRADEAILLWNEMIGKGNEKGCAPNAIAYMALIHGLCKCRMPDVALIYFHEMEGKQMASDSYAYVGLIEAFISDSNAPLALDMLRKMIQHEKFPNLLDKNFITMRDAVLKLLNDARTSSDTRILIAEDAFSSSCNIQKTGSLFDAVSEDHEVLNKLYPMWLISPQVEDFAKESLLSAMNVDQNTMKTSADGSYSKLDKHAQSNKAGLTSSYPIFTLFSKRFS